MTILSAGRFHVPGKASRRNYASSLATELSSRPERSVVERSAFQQFVPLTLDNPHRHSAVNHHVLASDEIIFNQSGNQRSDILGFAFFVQRDSILDIVPGLFRGKSIMKGSANNAGRNTVDPDALICKFAAEN